MSEAIGVLVVFLLAALGDQAGLESVHEEVQGLGTASLSHDSNEAFETMTEHKPNTLGEEKLLADGWVREGEMWKDPNTGKLFTKKHATLVLKTRFHDPNQRRKRLAAKASFESEETK